MDDWIREVKRKLIETLGFMDLTPEDIDEDAPLVGGDTGMDSIDVLEIVMMIERDYGVRIDNSELGAKVFATLRTMADFIREHRTM